MTGFLGSVDILLWWLNWLPDWFSSVITASPDGALRNPEQTRLMMFFDSTVLPGYLLCDVFNFTDKQKWSGVTTVFCCPTFRRPMKEQPRVNLFLFPYSTIEMSDIKSMP